MGTCPFESVSWAEPVLGVFEGDLKDAFLNPRPPDR